MAAPVRNRPSGAARPPAQRGAPVRQPAPRPSTRPAPPGLPKQPNDAPPMTQQDDVFGAVQRAPSLPQQRPANAARLNRIQPQSTPRVAGPSPGASPSLGSGPCPLRAGRPQQPFPLPHGRPAPIPTHADPARKPQPVKMHENDTDRTERAPPQVNRPRPVKQTPGTRPPVQEKANAAPPTKSNPSQNFAPIKPQPEKLDAQPAQRQAQRPVMPQPKVHPAEPSPVDQTEVQEQDPWSMDWNDDDWQADQADQGDSIPFDNQMQGHEQFMQQYGMQENIPFESKNQFSNDPIGFEGTPDADQGDPWGFNDDAQGYGEPFLDPSQYDAELENLMGTTATNIQSPPNAMNQFDQQNSGQESDMNEAGDFRGYDEFQNQAVQEPGFLPDGAYDTQSFLPEQAYGVQEGYSGGGYTQGEYAQGDYGQGDYAQADYGQGDYAQADYGQGDYAQADYGQGDYAQADYGQGDYAQADYGQGDYAQADYGQGDYAQADYGQGDYAQADYAQADYVQDEYAQGDYAQADYVQSEFTQGEYAEGEYAQDEYAQADYAQDEYAQGEYAHDEYTQGDYAGTEYAEGQFAQDGYNQPSYDGYDPTFMKQAGEEQVEDLNTQGDFNEDTVAQNEYTPSEQHEFGMGTVSNAQLPSDEYDQEDVYATDAYAEPEQQESAHLQPQSSEPAEELYNLTTAPNLVSSEAPKPASQQAPPQRRAPVQPTRKTVPAFQARSEVSKPPVSEPMPTAPSGNVEPPQASHRPLAPPKATVPKSDSARVPTQVPPNVRVQAEPLVQQKVPPRARSPAKPQKKLLSPPVVAERVQPPPALMEPMPPTSFEGGENWGWNEGAEASPSEAVNDAWGWDGDDQDWQRPDLVEKDKYAQKPHGSPNRVRSKPVPGPSVGKAGVKAAARPKDKALRADPVQERLGKTVPVATFGVGGKLVVYLPQSKAEGDAYEYDTPRIMRQVHIRPLAGYMGARPFSTLDMHKFPGPLMESSKMNHKGKKAAILRYLHEQIAESASGVGYLRRKSTLFNSETPVHEQGHVEEWRRMEDKILLLKILALLVENDGQWNASGSLATTVCNLLTGRSEEAELGAFSVPTYSRTSSQSAMKRPIRTYALRQGFLEELQPMLQQGDLQRAVDYAVEQKMWAHAMTISQQLDASVRNRVIEEFMRYELKGPSADNMLQKDYTSIKIAYALYSQQSSDQITAMLRDSTSLSPEAQHAQWRLVVATLIANHNVANGYETIVNAIGESLMANGLPEAAHVCYLLSHQHRRWLSSASSPFLLLGTTSSTPVSALVNDMDALLMTEVLEFILCLSQPKGAEPFSGIPALAPFKLMRAIVCDELGDTAQAKKYCEALAQLSQTKGTAQVLPPKLQLQLHEFMARLNGPRADGNHSWSKKLQRPTLDGVWGALEGRLTKFIAGEENTPEPQPAKTTGKGVGAFTHYSAITPEVASSDAPSANEADIDNAYEEQVQTGNEYEDGQEQDGYIEPASLNENPNDVQGAYAQDFELDNDNAQENLRQDQYVEGKYSEGGYLEGEYSGGQYAEDQYPEGQYPEGDFAEGEQPEGEYPEGQYTEGEYAEGEYPEGQYPEGQCAEGEYVEGDYPEGEYPEGQYTEGEYPEGQYAEGEYPEGEYAEGEYPEGQYAEGEYPEGEYAEGEYPEGQYAEGEYPEGEYAEGEYAEGEYAEGEYAEGEYAEGEYAEGEYPEGEYAEGEYPEGEYPEGQYAEGEYPEGEYPEGQYAEGEYAEGQYAERKFAEGEYAEGEYAEGEYVEGEYAEGEYPADEYADDDHPEGMHKGATHLPSEGNEISASDKKVDGSGQEQEQDPVANGIDSKPTDSEPISQTDEMDSAEQTNVSKPPLFHRVDAEAEPEVGEDGLLSTMPIPTLGPVPVSTPKQETTDTEDVDDAEDNLGLGNASHKEPQKPAETKPEKPADNVPEKPAEKSAGNSWLGRLLGSRNNSQSQSDKESKASKAHLGEETSFYYDKDLKRWVNKKAGDDGKAAPAALPPPPKAAPKPATSSSEKQGPPAPQKNQDGDAVKGTAAQAAKTSETGYGDPPVRKPAAGKPGDRPPTGGSGKKRPLKSRYIVVD